MSEKNQLALKSRIATISDCTLANAVKFACGGFQLTRFESLFMQFLVVAVAVFAGSAPVQAKHIHGDGVDSQTQETRGIDEGILAAMRVQLLEECINMYYGGNVLEPRMDRCAAYAPRSDADVKAQAEISIRESAVGLHQWRGW